ncbi:hypothetical protein LTR33_016223 [Friedmanniomyces endolithicus]|nr:hypothetical protein LTS01_022678 [Friedmanniomyces endolithicus]KAK1037430.1 hypothetical protein LTR33_016223 [Friedmanniomyces endolithicus]
MVQIGSLLALSASLIQLCISAPVTRPEVTLVEHSLIKRSETGPEMGGANFPDPSIIQVGSTWYAFATRTLGTSLHIQIASSPDFVTWSIVKNSDGSQKDALPGLPAWVDTSSPNTWAPDLIQLTDGSFVMYFSAATTSDPSKHCIGAASSSSITGPFTPIGSSALICPLSQGGAIDASGYYDNGKRYIAYKVDGNSMGAGGACNSGVGPYQPTPIMLQSVANDGHTLQGSPTTMLNNNGASDQGIVEAPSIAKSGSTYVLFFSSGCFTYDIHARTYESLLISRRTGNYNVNYATSSSITGGYTRAAAPLFDTGIDGLSAPGGADIFRDGKHMLFHANSGNGRALYEAVVTISGTKVTA